jgi:ABC-type transport system involved in cytochrome bd biosynthesis fused ATPase/permease subunit
VFPFGLVSGAYAPGTYRAARRFRPGIAQHAGWCGELTIVPDANPPPLLTLTGVSRRYGERVALSPVDLAVAPGQCVAVMGANGSGKSTPAAA